MGFARSVPFLRALLLAAVVVVGVMAGAREGETQAPPIMLDGSLGPGGAPPRSGLVHTIGAELGQTRGANLFHSFSQFSIPSGETANFTGLPTIQIQNILSRVTGRSPSIIEGTLRSSIPGANFFLLNPSGVSFGLGAKVALSLGPPDRDRPAFHVSTANVIRFPDGGVFGQDREGNPTPPGMLTSASPSAFGFLSSNPEGISIQGTSLQVTPQTPAIRSFSLIGGEVRVTSAVPPAGGAPVRANIRPGGTITVISVASEGAVRFDSVSQTPELSVADVPRLGPVTVSGGSALDARGLLGGRVVITGREVVLDNAMITGDVLGDATRPRVELRAAEKIEVTANTKVTTTTTGSQRGGDIVVAAPAVRIDGSGSSVSTQATGAGAPGDVRIEAGDTGKVTVSGGGTVGSTSTSTGAGAGGLTTITAGEVLITGQSSQGNPSAISSVASPLSNRDGSRVSISARLVSIEDGGAVLSTAQGNGRGGDVAVDAGSVKMSGGGQIRSRTASGKAGGAVTITADDSIDLSGRSPGGDPSGVFSSSCTVCAGAAGKVEITVRTGDLSLTDGAVIQSGSNTERGGSVAVTAGRSIVVGDGAALSSTSFVVNEGRVELTAPRLTLDGGVISTSTVEKGAGDVSVTVGTASLMRGGQIKTSSEVLASGDAGNLTLNATESVSIGERSASGTASGLFSTASRRGTGNAGQITVSAPTASVTVSDGGVISVTTEGTGNAGAIAVTARTLDLTGGGQIASSSESGASGRGGNLTVTATERLSIAGRSGNGSASGLFSTAAGTGAAGTITVSAPALTVGDRGRISVATSASGDAGGIDVTAGIIELSGGGRIDSGTSGAGAGGTATVSAREAITISGRDSDGNRSGIFSNSTGTGANAGAAGQVIVTTPVLTMMDGAISAQTFGPGRAGSIVIETGRLALSGGAQMDSTTFGDGAGGDVKITATESVLISGAGDGMQSSARGAGAAGRVMIATPQLTMVNGAVVAAETQGDGAAGNILLEVGSLTMTGGSSVTSDTSAGGRGGTVTVLGGNLVSLAGSRLSSTSTAASPGGDIDVSARQIRLSDGSQVTATGRGLGDAGSIRITARDSLVSRDGVVRTDSASGTGGNINVLVGSLLHLIGSSVTATVQGGVGRGGDIAIGSPATIFEGAVLSTLGGPGQATAALAPTDFVILERSQIRANAFGGPGGNVQIGARVFLQTESAISASSALGVQGTVDINAQITDVSGSLARLPDAILQASALLRESCAARVGEGRTSTLALVGRDGVPPEPGGSVSGPLGSTTIAGLARSDGAAAAVRPEIDGPPGHAARPPLLTLRCFK